MQVTKEQIDPCKIALTISVEADKVKAAKDKAFAQFAKAVQIPGFRKGKVPAQMAKAYVDDSRVRQRTAEMLFPTAYSEALEESEVEPFAGLTPDIDSVDFLEDGSFTFKAMVPLRPVITLGPYKGLEIERRIRVVTDQDVDAQIENLRARHAEYPEIADRDAQWGDVVLADLQATIEDQESNELSEPRATVIEIGKNIPDFDNGLVGLAVGETKTIDAVYPEAFPDPNLRGKRSTFVVTLKEIRARILPEITPEFLQKVRPGIESEEALRAELREQMVESAEDATESELEFGIVGKIVDNAQVYFPEALLRAEMQTDINGLTERLKRDNVTLEQYLASVRKSQQQIQMEFAQAADRRIRNSLVLSEIARTEEISVTDEDIDAQIEARAAEVKTSPAAVRAFAEKNEQVMNQFRDQALTGKILEFLKEQSHITDVTLTKAEAEAEIEPASAEAIDEATAAVAFDGAAVIDENGPVVPISEATEETAGEVPATEEPAAE